MPALRVGERQEGRPLEENGPDRQGTQRLREEIRAAGGNGFQLAEDTAVRMDRNLVRLFQFHSAKTAPLDNRNADSTGRHWLSKVFAAVEGMQEGVSLSGGVWIDGTYFPKWRSESETRGGKRLRGLSGNQFCVLTATDGEACALRVRGAGKPSAARAVAGYGEMIAKGSRIIHDGGKSRNALIEATGLSSKPTAPAKPRASPIPKKRWSPRTKSTDTYPGSWGRTADSRGTDCRIGWIHSTFIGTRRGTPSKRRRPSSNSRQKSAKLCAIEVEGKRKIPINPEIFIPHGQIRVLCLNCS